jgi:membrane fusion protein, copper/silver efflux system
MKIRFKALILLLIVTGALLAGYWVNHKGSSKPFEGRRILYYLDPMNPAYRSDKPGISPSCGMPLEPVYADNGGSVAGGPDSQASMPLGTIHVSSEKQQLIGVKVLPVEKTSWSHTVRVLGRVTPDETLIYRINAAVSGWIEEALPVTTGSLVKKDELLATIYSLEYRTLLQAYFNIIRVDNPVSPGAKIEDPTARMSVPQIKQARDVLRSLGQGTETSQADYYKKNLFNYGLSEYQLEEMERTRTVPDFIDIRAPIAGFILSRNVSPGLRFDRGVEFFRIADLSRVWILADVFENEASFFKPGIRVRMELPYQKRILYALISDVLPQFDPVSRTLKVRLVADNPDYIMRPDMFVNVDLSVSGPPAIIVPVGAVLDSGLKKTVFVDRGNGFFEPRQVETGRSLGERVEIARGLMPGEKIVVSGNFLLDSEARLQQAASGIQGKIGRDPVCGMNIDEERARADGNFLEYKGRTYFFCDSNDREEFRKGPERYLKSTTAQGDVLLAGAPGAVAEHASHGPVTISKSGDAKTAPDAHKGMAMPADHPPVAMHEMPAALPRTESKTGRAAAAPPSANSPGTTPSLPAPQGAMPMMSDTPVGAAIPGQKKGETFPSVAGASEMHQQPRPLPGPEDKPLPGSAGPAPIPGSMAGPMIAPITVTPGMDQGPPAVPGPGDALRPMPQATVPMSGIQPKGITPQPPIIRTPKMNTRLQRYPQPGTLSQPELQGAPPLPGSNTGRIIPPAAGAPDVKP